MKTKPEVTLLMPAYNEAKTIENVILDFYRKIGRKIPLQIMVIEDGSTDGTKKVLQQLSKKIPLKLFLEKKRRGYSRAVANGLAKIGTKFVVCVESDGQYFPEDFWKLFAGRNQYDIVSGYRITRADSLYRRIISGSFQYMARFLFKDLYLHDITCPYILIRTPIAKKISREIKHMRESFWMEFSIIAYNRRYAIQEVPVRHRKSSFRTTNIYTPFKIPKIVFSHFIGLLKLWFEENKLKKRSKHKSSYAEI